MNRIGDYNLKGQIGAGGMGEVWLAENMHTRLKYALKLLPQQATREGNFVARFFDEGRVMAQMEHPYIVRVHHVGQDGEQYFLVMDYIEGPEGHPQSLHELLQSRPDKRLTEDEVRKWAMQLAQGLAYAHEQGVVHRDIKPANIMVDGDGNVRLTDFGLAKAVGDEFLRTQIHQSIQSSLGGHRAHHTLSDQNTIDSGSSPRSTAESLLGTYDYMSPEQRGELPNVTVGPASDVYSLGVMLYRLLTGRRPTGRAKAVSKTVPGLSKHWDVIVDRCLEHHPGQRFAEGADILEALESVWGRAAPVGKRHTGAFVLGAIGLVLLVVGFIIFWPQEQKGMEPVPQSPMSAVTEPRTRDGAATVPFMPPETPPQESVVRVPSPAAQDISATEKTFSAEPVVPLPEQGELRLVSTPGVTVSTRDAQGQERILGETNAQGQLRMTGLQAGHYALTLSQADHQTGTAEVTIGSGQVVEMDLALLPLPGRLKLTGREGLSVYEQGRWLGQVNTWINLSAGEHDLELRSPGYRTHALSVEIPANQSVVKPSPMLAVAAGSIKIQVSAIGGGGTTQGTQTGRVRLDGGGWKTVSFPHLEAGLACRMYRVECQVEGYDIKANPAHARVEVTDHQQRDVTFSLTPQSGSVTVLCAAPEAQVYDAQGTRLGPVGEKLFVAPFAAHTLTVRAPGYESGTLAIRDVRPGQDLGRQEVLLTASGGAMAGQTWELPELDMRLAYVAPGTFMMGGKGGNTNAQPGHSVTLTRAYWLGTCEVTQAQYEKTMRINPANHKATAARRGLFGLGRQSQRVDAGQYPVETVSWKEAMSFCRRLTDQERQADRLPEGYEFRLPTEAEWEFAIRGGTQGRATQYAGSDNADEVAWHGNNCDRTTQAVGQKQANELGLYDMSGNVWEWCYDYYDRYPSQAQTDPKGAKQSRHRVRRGGAARYEALTTSVTSRYGDAPQAKHAYIGFRLALGPAIK